MIWRIAALSSSGSSRRSFLEKVPSVTPIASATCQRKTPADAAASRMSLFDCACFNIISTFLLVDVDNRTSTRYNFG
nr:MAG TPA: hypothetical protein [Caudoviricetes sp.]DAM21251.1 MAG TPA: hypothetical protein [Caudoviricetes sp.]